MNAKYCWLGSEVLQLSYYQDKLPTEEAVRGSVEFTRYNGAVDHLRLIAGSAIHYQCPLAAIVSPCRIPSESASGQDTDDNTGD